MAFLAKNGRFWVFSNSSENRVIAVCSMENKQFEWVGVGVYDSTFKELEKGFVGTIWKLAPVGHLRERFFIF